MNLLELFPPIRTFIFDVDGVLTDGGLLLTEDGHVMRRLHARDTMAMQMAINKGYKVLIFTSGTSESIRNRLQNMGIRDVHTGIVSKQLLLNQLVATNEFAFDTALYMGDDLPDIRAMQTCGLPCCPADAVAEVKQIAKYISPLAGGHGCVRDVVEKVLKLNGDWEISV